MPAGDKQSQPVASEQTAQAETAEGREDVEGGKERWEEKDGEGKRSRRKRKVKTAVM